MGDKKLLDIIKDHMRTRLFDEGIDYKTLPRFEGPRRWRYPTTRHLQATDPYLQPARQPYPDYLHPFTWRAP